jgi:glycine cleavage system H protein
MNFPQDLRYTKDHEWIKLLDDGSSALVGITDFAQSELGDIVFVETRPAGTKIGAHEVFGTVEAVKTVADLYAPVGGQITAVNETLDNAEIVNRSPYDEGWLIRMTVDNPSDIDALLTQEAYLKLIGE